MVTLLSLEIDLGGSFGVLLIEYREFPEGALWLLLALSGVLGVRLGPLGGTDGIRWLGKLVAFSCLILIQIGLILTQLC